MANGKILMTHNYSSWGGNLATVLALSKGLRDSGFDVEMAFPLSEKYPKRFIDSGFTVNDFTVKSKFDFSAITRLKRIIVERGIDIVHSHTRRADLISGYAAIWSGITAIATQHGQINLDGETFQFRNGISERIYNYILRSNFTAIVAVSREIGYELRDMCGVDEGRIWYIPNGLDPSPFTQNANNRASERIRLNFSDSDVVVLTVASLGRKGHIDLINAANILKSEFPNAKYIFAGTGTGEGQIKAQITKFQLEDTVLPIDFVDDIPGLMSACDIFCLPSYSEGLSIAIMEAMASGLPVVASDIGGNPDLVESGETGYIFPPRNPEQLADALRPLLTDAKLRSKRGNKGKETVELFFTAERMVEDYIKLYQSLRS